MEYSEAVIRSLINLEADTFALLVIVREAIEHRHTWTVAQWDHWERRAREVQALVASRGW